MGAAITDTVSKYSSGSQPLPTQLSAQKLAGASTASLNAPTGWDTTTVKFVRMYKTTTSGSQTVPDQSTISFYKCTLSGSTLSNLTLIWSATGSDQKYEAGDTVDLSVSAGYTDALATNILTHADQDGTLKAGAVDNAAVVASGILTADRSTAGANIETWRSEACFDFVASGCVWTGDAYGSTRAASMTSGVVYIAGVRVAVSAVVARVFTASKDTYIDVGADGTIDYTEVTNNAASPALAAGHIRLGIIVTGAGNIADAGSVNQGEESKVLPIASSVAYSVTDSLGNLICPRDPQRKLLGYRQITGGFQTTSTTAVYITGLTTAYIAPVGRKIKITVGTFAVSSSSDNKISNVGLWAGATAGALTTQYAARNKWSSTANWDSSGMFLQSTKTATAASQFVTASLTSDSGGGVTTTFNGDPNSPAYIKVELD